ncbi:MAG: phosphoserine phosphatase SerB [Hyphomicrobiales bacterium]
MTHYLTLIGAPGKLTPKHAAAAAGLVERPGEARWLSPEEAVDIPFAPDPDRDPAGLEETLRGAFAGEPIDLAIVPAAHRRKKLLVADMDSTMIRQECIDEIADFAGLRGHIAAITERAMRGEIEFAPALRERVGLLKGLDESVLQRVFDERVELMPGGRELVMTMRAHGALAVLVSGGFTFFTARVAERTGFDVNRANILEVAEGKLTGAAREPILGREAKLEALEHFRKQRGLAVEDTLAVGDGANDLAMIEAAGLGVAYHAKPVVAACARARVDHGDLTALLYLQGYAREEFSAG